MKSLSNSRILSSLLIVLFFFLFLSSWLVSLSGRPDISLVRDILVFIIFIYFLFLSKTIKPFTWVIATFIFYGLISYFWREASPLQWLRGFRFTFVPIVLLLSISSLRDEVKYKKPIQVAVYCLGIVIIAVSILQAIGLKIPLTTKLSGDFGLEQAQYIWSLNLRRLQSLLAGPNALGLFLVAFAAYCVGWFKLINNKASYWLAPIGILLLLTFSRSSILGFTVLIAIFLYTSSVKKYGRGRTIGWGASIALLLLLTASLLYQNVRLRETITHGESSTIRLIQYQRIWDTKKEIGLFGRGMGTAGPSSQNRLDGGPNHFTENIYLDIFEELGLIGLLFYLTIVFYLLNYSWKHYDTTEGKTAFLVNTGFAISGLFINYYTGQVGIYLLMLANGILINKNYEKNLN